MIRTSPLTERSRELLALLPVVRRAVQLTRLSPALACDAEQRALTSLAPHLAKLAEMDPRGRSAYAFRAATNAAFRVRREQGGARFVDTQDGCASSVVDAGASPESRLDQLQRGDRMQAALNDLDPADRELVAMVADGASEREAAEDLDVSRGAVAYRLRRARQALKRAWLGTTSWRGNREG